MNPAKMYYTSFRDRESLVAGSLRPGEEIHEVEETSVESEGLRRLAGRWVAVLHTAAGNAKGNCVAYIAGFGTRDAAFRAVAEAMANRLRRFGRNISAAEILVLGRRSQGRHRPEWGGPDRRYVRLSWSLHYGRVYPPLTGDDAEADRVAYEAYMARREAAEAEARAKAEAERIAAEAARIRGERIAAARMETPEQRRLRESREAREDAYLVSRLIWRAWDRANTGFHLTPDWAAISAKLARLGVRWTIRNPQDALLLADQPWFDRKCRACTRDGAELRNLRWKIRSAALRSIEVLEHIRDWAPKYVGRRRQRLRQEAGYVSAAEA